MAENEGKKTGLVKQEGYFGYSDDTEVLSRHNRRGEIIPADWMIQLVADGKVFLASNAARETAEAMAGTSFTDTDPALLLDVPENTTVIPLEICLAQGGTVAGAKIDVLITLSDKVRYSSGGVAITPQNMRFDEPGGASLCSMYTGSTNIVANANADDITLFACQVDNDVTSPLMNAQVLWTARKFIPPVLVGPAALAIYTFAGATEPSWYWHITWAEFPTSQVTGA